MNNNRNDFVCFYDSYSDANVWINLNQVQTVRTKEVPAGYSVEVTMNGGIEHHTHTSQVISSLYDSYSEAEDVISKLINGIHYYND